LLSRHATTWVIFFISFDENKSLILTKSYLSF
jgi:hypothetical protein